MRKVCTDFNPTRYLHHHIRILVIEFNAVWFIYELMGIIIPTKTIKVYSKSSNRMKTLIQIS